MRKEERKQGNVGGGQEGGIMAPGSQEKLYQDRSYENVRNWGEEATDNKKVEDKEKFTKNDFFLAVYPLSYLLPQSQQHPKGSQHKVTKKLE